MNEKQKEVLKKIYESLDMVKLRQEIEELLDELINSRIRSSKMKVNFRDKKYDLTSMYFRDIEL